jgi:hypothetical protein
MPGQFSVAINSVGDAVYGGDMRKLRQTTRALRKALGIPQSDDDEGGTEGK